MKLIRKLTTGIVCFIIGVALLICPSLDTFEDVAGLEMLYIGGVFLIASAFGRLFCRAVRPCLEKPDFQCDVPGSPRLLIFSDRNDESVVYQ